MYLISVPSGMSSILFKVVGDMAVRLMDRVRNVRPLPLPFPKSHGLFAIIAKLVNFDLARTIDHIHYDIVLFEPLPDVFFFLFIFGLKKSGNLKICKQTAAIVWKY